MHWDKIAEIAIAVVSAVGGSGAIIVFVGKWTFERLADALSKKYQLQLDKEKERYKIELSKKEYISKTRFETEFRIYQELSEKNTSLVYCAGETLSYVCGATYTKEEVDEFLNRFCDQLNETKQINRRYAPFIDEQIYDQFKSMEKIVSEMFSQFKTWRHIYLIEQANEKPPEFVYSNFDRIQKDMHDRQKNLSDALNILLCDLRIYLRKLDVIE